MIRQEIPPVPTFLLAKNVIYGHLGAIQSPYTSLADRPRIGTIGNHQIQGSLFDCSFLFTESDAFLKNYTIFYDFYLPLRGISTPEKCRIYKLFIYF